MGDKFGDLNKIGSGKLEQRGPDLSKLELFVPSGDIIIGLKPEMLQPRSHYGYAPEVLAMFAMLRKDFGAVIRTLWPLGVPVLDLRMAPISPIAAVVSFGNLNEMFPDQPRLAGLEWIEPDAPILANSRSRLLVTIANPSLVPEAVGKVNAMSKVAAFAEKAPLIVPIPPASVKPMVREPVSMAMAQVDTDPYWSYKATNGPFKWRDKVTTGTRIAVLDSGCDVSHPGFSNNIVCGTTETKTDLYGHGTFVCAVISSNKTKNLGSQKTWAPAGVLPQAGIWAMKVYDGPGSMGVQRYSTALQLIAGTWTKSTDKTVPKVANAPIGVQVVNISFSTDTASSANEELDLAAVKGAGVIVVAAAGNSGGNKNGLISPVVTPARRPWCISVGATNPAIGKSRWDRSCRLCTDHPVDIYAPGVDVASAFPMTAAGLGRYSGMATGTSMAAPFVSAAIAVLRSSGAYSSLVPDDLRSKLLGALRTPGNQTTESDGSWYRLYL